MAKRSTFLRWRHIFVTALCVAIAVLGGMVAFFSYQSTDQNLRQSLEVRAATIAELMPKTTLASLKGTDEDLATSQYQVLKDALTKTQQANQDTRFIYILAQAKDDVIFLADSEPTSSDDYSPPGQKYDEASPELRLSLRQKEVFTEGPLKDSYGTWLSGIASIVDKNGRILGAVGLDIAADNYYRDLAASIALPVVVTTLLIGSIVTGYIWLNRRFQEQDLQAEIVSVASHDLRSPLNGILWAAQTAANLQDTAQVKKILRSIEATAADLHLTVNTLLDLAIRKQTIDQGLELKPVNVEDMLQSVVTLFALSAQAKKIDIKVDMQTDKNLVVLADAERLRRAIANLVNNAVKYSKDQGHVVLSAHLQDQSIIIIVQDDGIGIPPAEQAKIMKGYSRGSNVSATEGTGLGLILVQRIIKAHQGTLALESMPEQGTTWTMCLPALPQKPVA